jgi:hypothetical protein
MKVTTDVWPLKVFYVLFVSSLQASAASYLTAAQQAVVQANAAAVARSMAQLQQQQRAFAQQQPPPSAHGSQQSPAFRGGSIMTGFPRYPAASTSRYKIKQDRF